jgi:hypothetical protein
MTKNIKVQNKTIVIIAIVSAIIPLVIGPFGVRLKWVYIPGFVSTIVNIVAVYIISFRRKMISRLAAISILSFMFLLMLLTLEGLTEVVLPSLHNSIVLIFDVCAPVVLPAVFILGILANVISFRTKDTNGRALAILFIIFLSIPLALILLIMLDSALPHIYTPPAITCDNLHIYNECVEFVKDHDEYKDLMVNRWPHIFVTTTEPNQRKHHFYDLKEAKIFFSKDELATLAHLSEQLEKIKFHKFQRDNNMVLFYRMNDPLLHVALPVAPGVAYSLHGENPNEIDSEVLNAAKPFHKVAYNWYMSRKLILVGPRSERQISIPKALIDHSLRMDGIDPNELQRFD